MRTIKSNLKAAALSATFLLASFTGCDKESITEPQPQNCDHMPTELPPLTHEGRNTAGCLMRGKVWVPHAGEYFGAPSPYDSIEVLYTPDRKVNSPSLRVRLRKTFSYSCDTVYQTINLNATRIHFGEMAPISNDDFIFSDTRRGGSCAKALNEPHFLEITHLDTVNKIVSGRFGFSAVTSRRDTIRFTDGRFDVHYKDYE